MIFRRRQPQQPAASGPSRGVAFWIGLQIGRAAGYLAGWTRRMRASIVVAGMALAILLFWLGHPGSAIAVGLFVLAVFWLAVAESDHGSARTVQDNEPET